MARSQKQRRKIWFKLFLTLKLESFSGRQQKGPFTHCRLEVLHTNDLYIISAKEDHHSSKNHFSCFLELLSFFYFGITVCSKFSQTSPFTFR